MRKHTIKAEVNIAYQSHENARIKESNRTKTRLTNTIMKQSKFKSFFQLFAQRITTTNGIPHPDMI